MKGDPASPPPDPAGDPSRYVSRGALKLEHALREFGIDPTGFVCADLGCSTGGFTDCLLQHGADRVFSVDTAYGQLAWKLRSDDRVEVMERTNALHAEAPESVRRGGGVDLVVIDLGWTRQNKAIPAALRWVKLGGLIITLIKPHYEAGKSQLGEGGVLADADAERIATETRDAMPTLGARVLGFIESPLLGGAVSGKRKKKGAGNREWLALVRPA